MKKFLVTFFVLLLTFESPVYAQLLSDSANLKILKTRSRLLLLNEDSIEGGTDLNDLDALRGQVGCGSVDIGNQDITSTLSGDINIIITGDIINTGNRCTTSPLISSE